MKPLYATLKAHHYSSSRSNPSYKSAENLYKDIGYDYADLIRRNSAYENTCAARMSLALIAAGVPFTGRLKIKNGTYKGRTIETGAKLLADKLNQGSSFGTVTTVANDQAAKKLLDGKKAVRITERNLALRALEGRQGVIFFWKFDAYPGGHIDLLDFTTKSAVCNSNCYFHESQEYWFWPLD